MCHWENLVGPFLVHSLVGPKAPPPPCPLFSCHTITRVGDAYGTATRGGARSPAPHFCYAHHDTWGPTVDLEGRRSAKDDRQSPLRLMPQWRCPVLRTDGLGQSMCVTRGRRAQPTVPSGMPLYCEGHTSWDQRLQVPMAAALRINHCSLFPPLPLPLPLSLSLPLFYYTPAPPPPSLLIYLPVPQETTSPAATLTPLRMDPPPPPRPTPQRLPLQPRQRRTNTAPTMAERAHPCNNNRGQPRTAKDTPEKTPGAARTLGDEPTHSLQGRGGRPRTPPSPQLRGHVRRGTSLGP